MLARRVTSECITTFRLAPHVLSSRERGAGGSDPVLPIRQELRFDFTVTPGMGGVIQNTHPYMLPRVVSKRLKGGTPLVKTLVPSRCFSY